MKALTLKTSELPAVSLAPDVVTRRDAALVASHDVKTVTNAFDQDIAVESLRELKAILKGTEDSREEVKGPVLTLGRKIDSLAKEFVAPVLAAVARIDALVTTYQREEMKRAAEAESARQAEQAKFASARIVAEAAERARLTAIAKAESEAQRHALEAVRAESDAEAERAQQAAAAAQAQADAKRRQQKEARQNFLLAQAQQELTMTHARVIPKSEGQRVSDDWKFAVTDVVALFQSNPLLTRIEPNVSAINAAIKNGLRECPGLKIWKDIKMQVR